MLQIITRDMSTHRLSDKLPLRPVENRILVWLYVLYRRSTIDLAGHCVRVAKLNAGRIAVGMIIPVSRIEWSSLLRVTTGQFVAACSMWYIRSVIILNTLFNGVCLLAYCGGSLCIFSVFAHAQMWSSSQTLCLWVRGIGEGRREPEAAHRRQVGREREIQEGIRAWAATFFHCIACELTSVRKQRRTMDTVSCLRSYGVFFMMWSCSLQRGAHRFNVWILFFLFVPNTSITARASCFENGQ